MRNYLFVRHLFIPLLSVAILGCGGKSAEIEDLKLYPKFAEVVREFMQSYELTEPEANSFEFAKKPDGWYVTITDPETYPIYGAELLFWSLKDNKYLSLSSDYLKSGKAEQDQIESYIDAHHHFVFYSDRFPYYGYATQSDDIISLLEDAGDLNDTLTQALASSYFNKSMQTLGSKSYELTASTKLSLEITDDSLAIFMDYGRKCLSTYDKIVARNPGYETFVGNVKTKMANDAVGMAQELVLRGRQKEADEFFARADYPNSVSDFGFNMLASCDSNAILFTSGDNDTYPLWYWQSKGFRKDVAVINASLVLVPFYAMALSKHYGLKTRFTLEILESKYATFVGLHDGNAWTEPASLEKELDNFETFLAERENATSKPESFEDYFLLARNVSIDSAERKSVPITFTNYYFYGGQMVILDWFKNYFFTRPIYYTFPQQIDFNYLQAYSESYGLVVRANQLNAYSSDSVRFDIVRDVDRTLKNLRDNFRYSPLQDGLEETRILSQYLMAYLDLSNYVMKDDKNKALEILDEGVRKYPLDLVDDCDLYTSVLYLYLSMEEVEKFNSVFGTYLAALEKSDKNDVNLERVSSLAENMETSGLQSEANQLHQVVVKKREGR